MKRLHLLLMISLSVVMADSYATGKTVSAIGHYDCNNVFAKILDGKLPATKIYEDDHVLAFNDIRPLRPVHILVIPKGKYRSLVDFSAKASDVEIAALVRALGKVANIAKVEQSGFSIMSNSGHDGGQTVPHLHFHLLGGTKVHWEEALLQQQIKHKAD